MPFGLSCGRPSRDSPLMETFIILIAPEWKVVLSITPFFPPYNNINLLISPAQGGTEFPRILNQPRGVSEGLCASALPRRNLTRKVFPGKNKGRGGRPEKETESGEMEREREDLEGVWRKTPPPQKAPRASKANSYNGETGCLPHPCIFFQKKKKSLCLRMSPGTVKPTFGTRESLAEGVGVFQPESRVR